MTRYDGLDGILSRKNRSMAVKSGPETASFSLGVHLLGCAPHRHVSHGREPQNHASYGHTFTGRAPWRHVSYGHAFTGRAPWRHVSYGLASHVNGLDGIGFGSTST